MDSSPQVVAVAVLLVVAGGVVVDCEPPQATTSIVVINNMAISNDNLAIFVTSIAVINLHYSNVLQINNRREPLWWAILDSNQRPQSYQDCALTN